MLINRETLECQIPTRTIMRLDRSWQIKRGFHPQISHTILHDLKIDGNNTSHLDSATERDLAVSLREMEIADAEFGALDVDGEVDFAASAEILDVAVSTMFGTACFY